MFSLGNPTARQKDKRYQAGTLDAGREQNMTLPEEMLGGKTAEISQQGCDGRRRSFLGLLLGAGGAGVGALLSVPLFRFILHPLLTATSSSSWKEIGTVEDLASITSPVKKLVKIEQRDGWRKIVTEKALYVCKDATGRLSVFSSVCPHLGCSIAWHGHTKLLFSSCQAIEHPRCGQTEEN